MSKCPPAPFLKHQIRNLKQTYQRNVHLGPKCWKPSLRKKHIQIILWVFSLALVPYAYMEATGFMSSSATSHQGAIEMFWLHFGGGRFHVVHLYLCECFTSRRHRAMLPYSNTRVMFSNHQTTNVHEAHICSTFCSALISDRKRSHPSAA